MNVHQDFQQRASRIPFHGLGLSVDVYSPDLFELIDRLEQRGLSFDYLEVFKATQLAMKEVRSRLPEVLLEYHADGLWVTQPDWRNAYPVEEELGSTANHLRDLNSHWLNQECASKQIGGYSFGTYLPPLFTGSSAQVTGENTKAIQIRLDDLLEGSLEHSPLFLLETPPLTYFAFGDLSYAKFFQILTDTCSCGVVLDIGHIWTVYRYSKGWHRVSLDSFLEAFLQDFPLERVVQIHLAGLGTHPAVNSVESVRMADAPDWPDWIDSHDDPIPELLFEILDRVLRSSRLVNVKGVALEVDTKPIELILEEYADFRNRLNGWEGRDPPISLIDNLENHDGHDEMGSIALPDTYSIQKLAGLYTRYVGVVTGRELPEGTVFGGLSENEDRNVRRYVQEYLPHEILLWGGDLREMFPQTIQGLEEQGIDLSSFVKYWYACPRAVQEPYDYFLLKIQHFVGFVQANLPHVSELAYQEAAALRRGYAMASHLEYGEERQDPGRRAGTLHEEC